MTPVDGGEDIFVHITGLINEVRENDSVTFDLENGRKDINATNVPAA
ncbi:cold shock domain-containing protein [Sphingobacterium sp. HMA12]